jgi:chromosome segregation ATPase
MYKRYPFLNYTDIFFFNADRSTILGSMSPERKSEVISKLFRIDKIDAYNSTAIRMASRIEASIESSVDELMNYTNVVTYLTDKLKNTKVPSRSVKELTRLRDKMMKLQANYIKYNESKSASDKIKGTLKFINDCVSSLTSKISAVNVTELNNKLNELAQSIESTKSIRDKIASLTTDLNVLKRDLASIMTRGSEVFNQLNKVKSNVCPTCGSRVVLKDLEQSLTTEMNDLLAKKAEKENSIMKLTSELAALNEKNVDSELYNLTNKYNELQSTLGALTSNKSELARLNKQAIEYTKQLSEVEEVAEVKLPEGFYDQFNEINFDLARHEEYNKLVNDLNFNKSKVDEINKKLADVKNGLSLVNKYIKLTGSTGDVYREVMTRISKDFSDDVIRYEVNQYKFRSKDHLDLDVQYNVAGRWVSYQSLSSGQKTMADINFLSRILVECGLLVFDETLKHLSQASTEYCLDLMRGMNVHAMILTTHMYGTESFANKLIDLKLDGTGLTKIDIR